RRGRPLHKPPHRAKRAMSFRTVPAGRVHRVGPRSARHLKGRSGSKPASVSPPVAFLDGPGLPMGQTRRNSETDVRNFPYWPRSMAMADTDLVHIVDDDASVRDSLAMLLEAAGF